MYHMSQNSFAPLTLWVTQKKEKKSKKNIKVEKPCNSIRFSDICHIMKKVSKTLLVSKYSTESKNQDFCKQYGCDIATSRAEPNLLNSFNI